MRTSVIQTARPSSFSALAAASGIALAPFAAHATVRAVPANDRHDRGRAANVVEARMTRKAG